MIGKAEVGMALIGIPVMISISRDTNTETAIDIFSLILTAGGLIFLSQADKDGEIDLKASQSVLIEQFDGIFDDLEALSWSR
jgi:hypothetical protein